MRLEAASVSSNPASSQTLDEATLMTAKEVAAYLRLPLKKVYLVAGDIALSVGTRRLRWRRLDIDQWLEGHRRQA